LTVLIAAVFITIILLHPLVVFGDGLCDADRLRSAACELEQQGLMSPAIKSTAAAAAGSAGSVHSGSKNEQLKWSKELLREFACAIMGFECSSRREVSQQSAAVSEQGCGRQQQHDSTSAATTAAITTNGCRSPAAPMSLYKQERLRLAQQAPWLLPTADDAQDAFKDRAAEAARRRAAAAAGGPLEDVDDALGSGCDDDAGAPQSLVHVAAAAVAVAGAAGITAGGCGVTGETLLTPVLLDFGVHPQAAAATVVLLVFMSSTSAMLTFIMQGRLIVSYALLFSGVAVIGAGLGGPLLMLVLRRCKARLSVLLMVLAAPEGLGGAALCVVELLRATSAHEGLGFRALCSST